VRPDGAPRASWLLLAALFPCGAAAQQVEVGAFAGFGSGGSIESSARRLAYPLESGLVWGGTLELALTDSWTLAVLYSRQPTGIEDALLGRFDITQERFMVGIQEQKGARGDRTRFFGAALFGATRLAPRGFDSYTRPALGLALGLRRHQSARLGLRLEARGFLSLVEVGGGFACDAGRCVFSFGSSSFLQGELAGGVFLRF